MQYKSYQVLFVVVGFVLVIVCARATAGTMEDDLIDAAGNGNIEAVKALLAAGADVNTKNNDGMTALIAATMYKRTEIVQLLKKAGAEE